MRWSLVSRIRLAIVGIFLLVGGGYVVGYAGGAEAVFAQVASAISSAVSSVPGFGSALANGVNSYVQGQLGSNYDFYYDVGLALIVVGLVAVAWGMRAPKAAKVATFQPQSLAPRAAPSMILETSRVCRYCGAGLVATSAFCPACGRSTA